MTQSYDKSGARVTARTEPFDIKLSRSSESGDFCAIPNTRQVWKALEDTLRLKGQKVSTTIHSGTQRGELDDGQAPAWRLQRLPVSCGIGWLLGHSLVFPNTPNG